MVFVIESFVIICAFFVLTLTFMSVARMHAARQDSNGVQWSIIWRIYLYGSGYVTGRPLRALFGYPILISALLLYPVSFAIGQRFDGTANTLHYLLLSRLGNILCQLCTWPGFAFCLDSLEFRFRSVFFALGLLVMGALLLFNPMAFLGYWPPFISDYQLF